MYGAFRIWCQKAHGYYTLIINGGHVSRTEGVTPYDKMPPRIELYGRTVDVTEEQRSAILQAETEFSARVRNILSADIPLQRKGQSDV